MPVSIAERFSTQCAVVYENNYDTTGTITRASIAHLTPAQLESMFSLGGLFADLDAWFHTAIEMKACGTRTNALYDWIMSGADRQKFRGAIDPGRRVVGGPSLVQPWVLAKQDSVVNADFWAIVNGIANSAYVTPDSPATVIGTMTAGPLTTAEKALGAAGDRVVRVVSRYGVELDEKWFNPRTVVYIFSRRAVTGQAENGAWRVLAASQSTDRTYVDVLLTSENAGSTQAFAAAPAGGILLKGVNNVNDFESFCFNEANWDGRKIVPFWTQTIRRTREVDDQYKEFMNRLNEPGVNRAWKEFGDISLIERNRQDEMNYQKNFVNAFFFQKPFNVSQTLTAYASLPTISTHTGAVVNPGTGGKLIGYRANFIGVLEQLWRCDRVKDLYGNPLNFAEWQTLNYQLKRARASRNGSCSSIDWWCNSTYAARIQRSFIEHWKQESLDTLRMVMNVDTQKERHPLGFSWQTYRFIWPQGLDVNIITHDAFDDLFSAHSAESQKEMGNFLLALDIGKPSPGGGGGSIYWAQLTSNRVTHRRGDLDSLARGAADWSCVMKATTAEVVMTSETGTVVVECPQDNLWMWNIGDAAPIMTGATADTGNAY